MSLFGATLSAGSLCFFSWEKPHAITQEVTSFSYSDVSVWCSDDRTGRRGPQSHSLHTFATINFSVSLDIDLFFVADDKNNHIAQSHAGEWLSRSVSFRIPDCDLLIIKELFCRHKNYKAERQGKYKEHKGSASWYTDWRMRASWWVDEADLKIRNVNSVGTYRWGNSWRRKAGTA